MSEKPDKCGQKAGSATTQFKAGNPGKAKGQKNKINAQIVDDIMSAYKKLGGVKWLLTLAKEDKKTFCRLIERVIPKDINLAGGLVMTADEYILSLVKESQSEKAS